MQWCSCFERHFGSFLICSHTLNTLRTVKSYQSATFPTCGGERQLSKSFMPEEIVYISPRRAVLAVLNRRRHWTESKKLLTLNFQERYFGCEICSGLRVVHDHWKLPYTRRQDTNHVAESSISWVRAYLPVPVPIMQVVQVLAQAKIPSRKIRN